MDITVQEHVVKHMVVSLNGRVDAFSVPVLQHRLDGLLEEGMKHFILDLSEVHFMDSAGLAVLVKLLKRVSLMDGTIVLVQPKAEAARRILRLTHFDKIFSLKDTVDEATSSF
jgi:anti-sigma B factor antagonist